MQKWVPWVVGLNAALAFAQAYEADDLFLPPWVRFGCGVLLAGLGAVLAFAARAPGTVKMTEMEKLQ